MLGSDSSEVGAQAHNRLFKHILDFGLLETWIEPDKLFRAMLLESLSTSVVLEKSAMLFYCDAPEMFCGLRNVKQL